MVDTWLSEMAKVIESHTWLAPLLALAAGILTSVTPVLIALLAIVAGEGNLLWGILLMLLYSVGHSALVVVAGTSVGFVQRISQSHKYKAVTTALTYVMGAAILLIGFYMF